MNDQLWDSLFYYTGKHGRTNLDLNGSDVIELLQPISSKLQFEDRQSIWNKMTPQLLSEMKKILSDRWNDESPKNRFGVEAGV